MFDLSWAEILVIVVVALVAIGPNEIPNVMMHLGRMARKVQHVRFALTSQFDDVMRAVDLEEVRKHNEKTLNDLYDTDEADADDDETIIPPSFDGNVLREDGPDKGSADKDSRDDNGRDDLK